MSHEFDRMRIEELIRQAKQTRADRLRQLFLAPAVKKAVLGLVMLVSAVLPSIKGGSES